MNPQQQMNRMTALQQQRLTPDTPKQTYRVGTPQQNMTTRASALPHQMVVQEPSLTHCHQ